MMKEQLNRIEAAQQRTEAKLDALLDALVDDGDEEEIRDLDGNTVACERDQGEPL